MAQCVLQPDIEQLKMSKSELQVCDGVGGRLGTCRPWWWEGGRLGWDWGRAVVAGGAVVSA